MIKEEESDSEIPIKGVHLRKNLLVIIQIPFSVLIPFFPRYLGVMSMSPVSGLVSFCSLGSLSSFSPHFMCDSSPADFCSRAVQ